MPDDIVTRLRNSCAHLCDQCERENAYGVGDEAADEIEQLRDRCQSNDQEINMLLSAQGGWGRADRLREAGNALALAVKTGLSVDSALENWEAVSDRG